MLPIRSIGWWVILVFALSAAPGSGRRASDESPVIFNTTKVALRGINNNFDFLIRRDTATKVITMPTRCGSRTVPLGSTTQPTTFMYSGHDYPSSNPGDPVFNQSDADTFLSDIQTRFGRPTLAHEAEQFFNTLSSSLL